MANTSSFENLPDAGATGINRKFDATLGFGHESFSGDFTQTLGGQCDIHSLLPKMEFPIFDGSCPRIWIMQCNNFFNLSPKISDVQKIDLAIWNFEGKAYSWILELPINDVFAISWIQFCEVVCTRFTSLNTVMADAKFSSGVACEEEGVGSLLLERLSVGYGNKSKLGFTAIQPYLSTAIHTESPVSISLRGKMEPKSSIPSSSLIDKQVFPGDVILDLSKITSQTIKLGGGLRQDGDAISVMKAGVLRFSKPNKYWVESSHKRYVPSAGDNVLGIVVDARSDNFFVDIKGPAIAFLPVLAFEGGTRRNIPKFEIGTLLYVRVVKADTGMNPELSCMDASGKAADYGPLKDGFMFETSTGLSRTLLSSPTCPVLETLGKKIAFEIAVGLNGRVWVNASTPSIIVLVTNTIIQTESMSPEQILTLCNCREDFKKKFHSVIDKFAERGLRSLAVARQVVPEKSKDSPGGPWQFIGLLFLVDPPRHDSVETIRRALNLGVNAKMITGDQLAIGKETGRRFGMGVNMYLSSSSLLGNHNGHLSPQEHQTVEAIIKVTKFPLSFILVGVGNGPWDMMREFDNSTPSRDFDNFQFVNFTEIMSKNTYQARQETEFTLSALMKVPSQYKATMELSLLGGRNGNDSQPVSLLPPVYGAALVIESYYVMSVGAALRQLYERLVICGDFILVTEECICCNFTSLDPRGRGSSSGGGSVVAYVGMDFGGDGVKEEGSMLVDVGINLIESVEDELKYICRKFLSLDPRGRGSYQPGSIVMYRSGLEDYGIHCGEEEADDISAMQELTKEDEGLVGCRKRGIVGLPKIK